MGRLYSIYGISQTQYQEMVKAQDGRCAICGEPWEPLYVDHNHATGQVRGLLCPNCNAGLGMFKDSPTLLRRAASYVVDTEIAAQTRVLLAPRTQDDRRRIKRSRRVPEEDFLTYFQQNPGARRKQVADYFGITEEAVRQRIQKLVQAGKLRPDELAPANSAAV